MKHTDNEVIIVGAGLAGLSCAHHLAAAGIPFVILEAGRRIGGRIKTDRIDGFLSENLPDCACPAGSAAADAGSNRFCNSS